ncbi:MAG: FtsK/SpoIIIE domain-containing protein [Phycisphaerales bacterium JB050]
MNSSSTTPASGFESGLASSLREAVDLARRMTRERAEAQARIDERWDEATSSAQRQRDKVLSRAAAERDAVVQQAESQFEVAAGEQRSGFEAEHGQLEREYRTKEAKLREGASSKISKIEKSRKETNWLAEEVSESDVRQAREILNATTERLKEIETDLDEVVVGAHAELDAFGLFRPDAARRIGHVSIDFDDEEPAESESDGGVDGIASASLDEARAVFERIASCSSARFAQVSSLVIVGTVLMLGGGASGLFLGSEMEFGPMVGVGAGVGVVLTVVVGLLLRGRAKAKLDELYGELEQVVSKATARLRHERDVARGEFKQASKAITDRRARELAESNESHDKQVREVKERFEMKRAELAAMYRPRLAAMEKKHEARMAELNASLDTTRDAANEKYEEIASVAQREFDEQTREAAEERDRAKAAMTEEWTSRLARFEELAGSLMKRDHADFPDWSDGAWAAWAPPHRSLGASKFGRVKLDLSELPGGLPEGDDLPQPKHRQVDLPALLEMPRHASLLLEYPAADDRQARRDGESLGQARSQAIGTLQAVMLRMLTSLPPAKCRFTIIDPVGLGQNFAGFMHLADYNDQFVNHRIWTESKHIEARLSELTEHMENVIQKYLRNEFETIDDYNEKAGEIAEPYRFLVISDFPVNFDESSARRLASIVSSGARCGVHTLIACDTRENLPAGIQLSDMRDHATTLVWKDRRFRLVDQVLADADLVLDEPPSEDRMTEVLKRVGEASRDASRVEVPFKAVAPGEDEVWSRSSAKDIRVPLGRSGATKLQDLALGHGTAQHVLLAGKTGSGKSTLLHVLITNLAMWYSPEEVEFYLVDFKKGVEFKAYAGKDGHGPLPHARAVAIESDREFGLSVLQRVDEELKRRGDLFRDAGVQNLDGFRQAKPGVVMPRTLLIIDEFQELFVEDDKLSQDASLLLDRLVRQGRAFGIHVILGSQTLGGAYSLARSTLGQMAIRIALQCNEADSYLILNEENSAARLLSRPGEAIYNDQAGMVEGNSPFQIVWLPDAQRDDAIAEICERTENSSLQAGPPALVFEGNIPAKLERNELLRRAAADAANTDRLYPNLWLGEAIAIKDPTAAKMRRQSGSNLLVIGQREEASLGLMMGVAVSVAAQCDTSQAQLYIVDSTPDDDPRAHQFESMAKRLPADARVVPGRDLDSTLEQIAEEVRARIADNETDAPGVFLLLHSIQRLRSLRRNEDSFGFSMDDEAKPSPDKLLVEILRDGPGVGVHVVLSCDTLTNTERYLDRNAMREIENRVLFQMSSGDSTQLIDSPAASRLGPNRAIFYSEESGVIEKFRPYAALEPDEAARVLRSLGLAKD